MTTQTEEATRPASVEQQIGRLEGGYDQLGRRVEDQTIATNKLRDETNANFAAQTAATNKLRDETNANFAAQTAATNKLRDELHAQGESLRAELHAQGESLRAEIRSRFNTMMVVGATVAVANFGALIAIILRS